MARGFKVWHAAYVAVALLVVWQGADRMAGPSPSSTASRGLGTVPVSSAAQTPTTVAAAPRGAAMQANAIPVGLPYYDAVPAGCVVRGSTPAVLPDPRCTPGATNPDVRRATLASTICKSGWTSTVRPSSSYTTRLKLAQMAAWGITGSTRVTEEDHLIPLELGGAPSDSRNLWPESGGIPNPKDRLENHLKSLVCSGQLKLKKAQAMIATDWVAAYRETYGVNP